MQKKFTTIISACLIISILVCRINIASAQSPNPDYNKQLADSLGANENGMKTFTFVILKTGTVEAKSKQESDSLFAGHMSNITRLVKSGKLIVAGPFQKNDKQYRGLFILNTASKEEAEALLQTDPAISSKLLAAEIFTWYGSAALSMYLPYAEAISKNKF